MKLYFDKKSGGKTIAKKGSVCEFIRKNADGSIQIKCNGWIFNVESFQIVK